MSGDVCPPWLLFIIALNEDDAKRKNEARGGRRAKKEARHAGRTLDEFESLDLKSFKIS
jgi:hypothetical protein